MFFVLIMLLNVVLAALSVVSLVKNFLVNFNVSDNGWKTALVVTLVTICLLCAVISYSEAYTIRDINAMQPSSGLKQEDIDELKSLIPAKTATTIIAICIGYASYFLHGLLIKNIRVNKLKALEANATHRWSRT